jgi:hypothetical protein
VADVVRFELEPTAYALRVYVDETDNCVATAQIRIYGNRGWVSSISGPRVFGIVTAGQVSALMDQLNVVSLEGYMTRAMARALRIASKGQTDYQAYHIAGTYLPWVVLRRTDGAQLAGG